MVDPRTIAGTVALGGIAALIFPRWWKAAFALGLAAGGGVILLEHLSSQVSSSPGSVQRIQAGNPSATIESTDVPGVSILRDSDGSVRIVNESKKADPLGRLLG